MRFQVTIKRTTVAYGSALVDAVDQDHAEQVITNDPDIFITDWETGSKEDEVEKTEEL